VNWIRSAKNKKNKIKKGMQTKLGLRRRAKKGKGKRKGFSVRKRRKGEQSYATQIGTAFNAKFHQWGRT
jgi:hypothetical protein